MKLRKISFAEYISLEDHSEYDFAIQYADEVKPADVLKFGELTKHSFGEVKDLQYLFQKDDSLFRFVKYMNADELGSLSVFDFFAFFKYISAQVGRVNEIENKLLSHYPSQDEEEAGLERFAKFSSLIQVDSLAGGKIYLYEKIRSMLYEDCLMKLSLDKERSDFQRDLQNVMKRKNRAQWQ